MLKKDYKAALSIIFKSNDLHFNINELDDKLFGKLDSERANGMNNELV